MNSAAGVAKISMKMDGARELQQIRREVTALSSAPTVPIDVGKKESSNNGAVEKPMQTWEGQFRTLKSHIELVLDEATPLTTQCCNGAHGGQRRWSTERP